MRMVRLRVHVIHHNSHFFNWITRVSTEEAHFKNGQYNIIALFIKQLSHHDDLHHNSRRSLNCLMLFSWDLTKHPWEKWQLVKVNKLLNKRLKKVEHSLKKEFGHYRRMKQNVHFFHHDDGNPETHDQIHLTQYYSLLWYELNHFANTSTLL